MLRPIPRVVRLRPPTQEAPSRPLPMLAGLASERGELRVLDFDIENRPLSYWYDGKSTAEITAIAWWWIGEDPSRSATAWIVAAGRAPSRCSKRSRRPTPRRIS
jgi:hypothetical protein